MRLILGTTTAALAWSALVLQIWLNLTSGVDAFGNPRTPWMSMVDLFGYFTILTNLLVALVITIPAIAPRSAVAGFFSNLRTTWTAAAAIVVVGVAYHVLLSALYNPTGLAAWTDLAFHYLVPTLFAVYWVTTTEMGEVRFLPQIGVLSLYPFVYFVYVIGRGEVLGTYPYPFVDVGKLGLLGALRNATGILVFYLFVAWVMALVAGWLSRRHTGERAPVLSTGDWLVTLSLGSIPIVNLIMMVYWALSGSENPNRSNFAKAALVWTSVIIVLWLLLFSTPR